MAKINVLGSNIYNRIAAGEVVDRPYSVVKEFVENSLDAGAKNISVQIEKGGKSLICIQDDGEGIEKSDLPTAFLPHATSKIGKVEDLDLIRTLGFRGEALASIASVAQVCIRSKYKDAAEAYEISCNGGEIGDVLPCALGAGTEICAENLFYNTPVRAKFLKTDKGEESEISNFISRFILGNPNVAFTYFVDGKQVMQSFGGGLEEAVAAVYGGNIINECYRIDAVKHGIRLYGYIGKPSFTKANRTYQSVFVNGRYVVNNTVSSAISNAYASYLMKRQYPFYVLFLDIPPEIVDVNVHPNKSDVRFANNQIIYGSIYSIVSSVLDGNASALDYIVGAKTASTEQESIYEHGVGSDAAINKNQDIEDAKFSETNSDSLTDRRDNAASESKKQTPITEVGSIFTDKSDSKRFFEFHDSGASVLSETVEAVTPVYTDSSRFDDKTIDREDVILEKTQKADGAESVYDENKQYLAMLDQKARQQKIIFERAKYKGCLFNTYLLYEEGDDVYIIDQHAAHERLLFDRLRLEMDTRQVVRQPMLVPYVLTLNHAEFSFFSEHIREIEEIGFEIELFGADSFKISAVPADLHTINISAFFNELLTQVGSLRGIRLSELLRDKIAMTACKHAVKGGMVLSDSEKDKLFDMLQGDMGLKCPHGRPIAVRLSKTEIEKMFKRIV